MRFLIKSEVPDEYLFCERPDICIEATTYADVLSSLREAERLQAQGYYVACCLSYESAPAFDSKHLVHAGDDFPLLALLASRKVERISLPEVAIDAIQVTHRPRIQEEQYNRHYQSLVELIHAGDLYQANYSFRTELDGISNGFSLFCQIEREHPTPYAGFLEFGDWQVISLSPELFLEKQGHILRSEPMKGTAPRGLSYEQDLEQQQWLTQDQKNRAENVMIVDLMRNDLSRICKPDTIHVATLFSAKRYRTLFQMVSEVTGQLREGISLIEILAATFPAGSITGAPKIRAMQVIHDIEPDPRRAYTGLVGLLKPNGDFVFNVAIRTITVCLKSGSAELGIGSGVVSHSLDKLEWQECLLKAQFLNVKSDFNELFETILWDDGYLWLAEHLERLRASCEYFQIPFSLSELTQGLDETAQRLISEQSASNRHRVRISTNKQGKILVSSVPIGSTGWADDMISIVVSEDLVDENSCFQYHKTDHRKLYDQSFASALKDGFSEVVFFNQSQQLAEGAISNLFVLVNDVWITPTLTSGLLPGIWRQHMVADLKAREVKMTLQTLLSSQKIMIGNSVRKGVLVDEVWSQDKLVWKSSDVQ